MKTIYGFFLLILVAPSQLMAQTVGLGLDSGSFLLKDYDDLATLSPGLPLVEGDGDVVQFGYYTGATALNPFLGSWVALTGDGGANSDFSFTSIGDTPVNGAGGGQFAFTAADLIFTQGSPTSGADLPAAGQIMAVRFYNNSTVASSTYFGATSDANWNWVAPSFSAANMSFSLDDPDVIWLSEDAAFTGTALVVPEPSLFALLGIGLISILACRGLQRRRRTHVM